jgi:serine protease inhibitor
MRPVEVQLPKFQIKHKIDVRRTLRKQGVTDAFDPQRADFSGITGVNKYEQDEMEDGSFEQTSRFRRNPFLNTDMMDYEMMNMNEDFLGKRETKLHLNKFIHQATIKITENGITATTGSQTQEYEQEYESQTYGRTGRMGGMELDEMNMFDEISGGLYRSEPTGEKKMVKANHAFAFVLKHNPTQQLLMVGRVIDAAQKKVNNVHQTINTVDQF